MKLLDLIDIHLKPTSEIKSNYKSPYEAACEFVKKNSLQNEEIPEDIVDFIALFAKGGDLKEDAFNKFYTYLNDNFSISKALLSLVNEIAMDIYDRHREEIQSFVAKIEEQLNADKSLSFPDENNIGKYRALLNIYCLVKAKKLPFTNDPTDKSHFCSDESRNILNLELPFAINTLTLMNLLPKRGNYCGIALGEPIYPNFEKRKETEKEIPLDRKGIKDWRLYFPFKQITKSHAGDTGNNTFLATNGKKTLFIRGLSVGYIYTKKPAPENGLEKHPRVVNYSSGAIMASKIATFVSEEHFSSERLLSNGFTASKKLPNYMLSYANVRLVRTKFNIPDRAAHPGEGIVDEVICFLKEEDTDEENYGFSADRYEDLVIFFSSVVCKVDFDQCDLTTPIPTNLDEYEKNRVDVDVSPGSARRVSYYNEKLYTRLKLAVMSKEFISALAEKAYPENQSLPTDVTWSGEQQIFDEKSLVIEEIVRRTDLALDLSLENTRRIFWLSNPDVFNRILKESIEYIKLHFSEQDQPKLIQSMEERIKHVKKKVEELVLVLNLNREEEEKIKLKSLVSANDVLAEMNPNINADKAAGVNVKSSKKEEEETLPTNTASTATDEQIPTASGSSMKNEYEILGVEEDASFEKIKKAYYKAALKMHPDKGGSGEEFQKLQAAYATLLDLRGQKLESSDSENDSFDFVSFDSSLGDLYNQIPDVIKEFTQKLELTNDLKKLHRQYLHIVSLKKMIEFREREENLKKKFNRLSSETDIAADQKVKELCELIQKFEEKFSILTRQKTDELDKSLQGASQIFGDFKQSVTWKFEPFSIIINTPLILIQKGEILRFISKSTYGKFLTPDYFIFQGAAAGTYDVKFLIDASFFDQPPTESAASDEEYESSEEEYVSSEDEDEGYVTPDEDVTLEPEKYLSISESIRPIATTSTTPTTPPTKEDITSVNTTTPTTADNIYQNICKNIVAKIVNYKFDLHGGKGKKLPISEKFVSNGAYAAFIRAYKFADNSKMTEDDMRNVAKSIYEQLKDKRSTHLGFFGIGRRDRNTVELYKDILKDLEGHYQEKSEEALYANACVPPRC